VELADIDAIDYEESALSQISKRDAVDAALPA
jgi:hypothetical protein